MREIKISLETATRWYNGTDEELKALAIQTYPELAKKEFPKSWEELGNVSGYYVDASSDVHHLNYVGSGIDSDERNTFATKEQAEASIALAQLSQLREVYRNGWVPDFSNSFQNKHVIDFHENKISKETYVSYSAFLSFQDPETRDLFLENFRELIEKAKPLLS